MDKQKVMLEIKSAEAWIHALSDDYKPRRKIKGLVNADADTLTSSKQNLKKDTVHSHITTSAHFRQEEWLWLWHYMDIVEKPSAMAA